VVRRPGAVTRPQRRVIDALHGQRYPMMGHEIATLAQTNRIAPTLRSLCERGILAHVVRQRSYANGESRSVMGYILTKYGEMV
jgi:hypothetical protein